MNGPKFSRGKGNDRVGIHNHIHDNPVNATDNGDLKAVIAKDATLLQDRSHNRASFQGRFRKTTFGDFKGRPGHVEMSEAAQEDYAFNQAKEEAALAAAAVTEAAAADGVIIEPSNG